MPRADGTAVGSVLGSRREPGWLRSSEKVRVLGGERWR